MIFVFDGVTLQTSHSAFCTKNNRSCPRIHQVTERLSSFEISRGKSLDNMLVYAKDYDSSADYRILNSFETHPQSPGFNHSKRSIGNVRRIPVSVCRKTKMAVLKSG